MRNEGSFRDSAMKTSGHSIPASTIQVTSQPPLLTIPSSETPFSKHYTNIKVTSLTDLIGFLCWLRSKGSIGRKASKTRNYLSRNKLHTNHRSRIRQQVQCLRRRCPWNRSLTLVTSSISNRTVRKLCLCIRAWPITIRRRKKRR